MKQQKKQNQETKIDGVKAIYDYTNCNNIKDCDECECFKTVGFKNFSTLCDFLRTYTAKAKDDIEQALNIIL